uniref:CCT domain-containing protein n=2 Tax=Kalanchoe fedtschenkoi TaxID=63787 RepID=A0A7N0UP30_KALFE
MGSSPVNREDDQQLHDDALSSFDSPDGLMSLVLPDDVVLDPPDPFPSGGISSPIQIFDFCDSELFPPQQTLTSSEDASCTNRCYDENSSYSASISLPQDIKFGSGYDNSAPATAAAPDNNCSNPSMIFDPQDDIDNDISASINFSPSGPFPVPPYLASAAQESQFDISQTQPHMTPTDPVISGGMTQYPTQVVDPLMAAHPLPPVFEDECLSSVHSFVRVNPSSSAAPPCSLLDLSLGPYLLDSLSPTLSAADNFAGSNLFMGSEMPQPQTLGYQDDTSSYFCPDSMQRGFYSGEIQSLCSESGRQWMRSGAGNSNPSMASEMEEPSYKVGKLSVEQRKEKIHRYMKKRNERNFSKKIKYACRKTLADSRPRVRGRFAKNDEYGPEQSFRGNYSQHEDDEDDDMTVKEEDEILSSSDIFSHISGVNSFKYNFSVQSWT